MKKIIIPILLGLALIATSCESLLDIPQKGVISYSNFFESDADAQASLANMYATFCDKVAGATGYIYCPELMILNYSADDVLASGGDAGDHGDFRIFCEFRYDQLSGALAGLYNNYASVIYACNFIISNFSNENRNGDEPKFTSAFTKQCVEEARVMRAYIHMMMALCWNRPYIVDRILEGDELPVQAESQKQVLDWVIAECEKAISSGSLTERASTSDKNATARMTKGFAQFVAGKAAVFNNDMATARKYLGDLINSGKYALVPGNRWWENFHTPGDGNEEKIFEPNWVYDANNSSGDNQARAKWNQNNTLNWRGKNMNSWPVCQATTGWNGGAINGYFADKFLAHDGNGPRRMGTFFTADEWLYGIDSDGNEIFDKFPWMRWDTDYVGDNHTSGELKPASEWTLADKKKDPKRGMNANGFFGRTYYMNWKFMSLNGIDVVPEVSSGASNQSNSKCARYAEALLLYAEACIGSSDAAKGKEALNQIQRRAEVPETELTLANVQEEKQYELWFESCRFHDVVRWGIADQVCGKDLDRYPEAFDAMSKLKEPEHRWYYVETKPYDGIPHQFIKGKHEYFPFPADVCAINPALHQLNGWATDK